MTTRLDPMTVSPALFKAFAGFSQSLHGDAIDPAVHDLVTIRASQLNGCAFCLDMHIKQAKIHGERELRLHHVAIWRESPLFDARERAALAWTEVLTRLPAEGVPDEAYEQARGVFSELELTTLTYAVMVINGWNRLNIAFRPVPGSQDKAYGLTRAQFG